MKNHENDPETARRLAEAERLTQAKAQSLKLTRVVRAGLEDWLLP